MYRVYLAGPIAGLSYDEADKWRDEFTKSIKESNPKIDCVSPLRGKYYLKDCKDLAGVQDESLGILSGGPAIVSRDHYDCSTAELIVVNLFGAKKVSIGTMFEIAWAHHMQKPIVLVIEDGIENIHSHSMLFSMCNFRVNNLDDALYIVNSFFN